MMIHRGTVGSMEVADESVQVTDVAGGFRGSVKMPRKSSRIPPRPIYLGKRRYRQSG
jgi:hypothetical protein